MTLSINSDDIETFARLMFRYASDGGYVSNRVFLDSETGPPVQIKAVKINGAGLAPVIACANEVAAYAAMHPKAAVFCPPVATFMNGNGAKEEDLLEGLALSVECDKNAVEARAKLERLLGPATAVVASGGEWTNPETGEIEPKLHIHWRLKEPATKLDHAKLKEARTLATKYVGGDTSNNPMVHPIRWPGSVHRKKTPKLATFVEVHDGAEIDLDEALERLREIAPVPDVPATATGRERRNSDGTDLLIHQIVTGDSYHAPLTSLSARYIGSGMKPGAVVDTLHGLMDASGGKDKDALRWAARRNSIPDLVNSAARKFSKPSSDHPAPEYVKSRNGEPKPIFANVLALLRSRPEWNGVLAFDEFAGRHTVVGAPPTDGPSALFDRRTLADSDLRATTEWVQQNGIAAPSHIVWDALLKFSEEQAFHPVKDYLEGFEWDQNHRLEAFLIDHAGVANTPFNRAITLRWMVQAVARIYRPGCQADATLILEGDQGIGKSSLLRALFGPWFSETLADFGSKDAMLQLRGTWCVELAELATLGRADQNSIKAFLTTVEDQFRAPYDRTVQIVKRSNVFAGTVNPGGAGYLKDATGARRFWPVEITQAIDQSAIAAIRDQLWAEALSRYQEGQAWHLAERELVEAAAEVQAARFEADVWEPDILRLIAGRPYVTMAAVLEGLGIEPGRRSQSEQNRVANVLKRHGWTRRQLREEGARGWVYQSPV